MKPSTTAACILLGLISLVQLTRVLMGWVVLVNGVNIPIWVSGVACVVTGGLAVGIWREARR